MPDTTSMAPQHSISSRVPTRVVLTAIVLLGVFLCALRLTNGHQIGISHDDAVYLVLAEGFATGRPFRLVSDPSSPVHTEYPWGYPLIVLAPVWPHLGPDPMALALTSPLLLAVLMACLYAVLRNYYPWTTSAALLAIMAINPAISGLAARIGSDLPYLLATSITVLVGLRLLRRSNLGLALSLGVAAALATMIRYHGVTLAVAVIAWVLLRLGGRRSTVTGATWAALVALSAAAVGSQGVVSLQGTAAAQVVVPRLLSVWSSIPQNLWGYFQTVPALILPLFGPSLLTILASHHLEWLPILISSLIWVPILYAVGQGIARRELVAFYLLTYAVLVVALTARRPGLVVFDEPRYAAAVLPFVLIYFSLGIREFGKLVPLPGRSYALIVLLVLSVYMSRTARDLQSTMPVPDISVGAQTFAGLASPDDVVVTVDAVPRYLYLRHPTVELPDSPDLDTALCSSVVRPDYLLLAPPLTLHGLPNFDGALSPNLARLTSEIDSRGEGLSEVKSSPDLGSARLFQIDGPGLDRLCRTAGARE